MIGSPHPALQLDVEPLLGIHVGADLGKGHRLDGRSVDHPGRRGRRGVLAGGGSVVGELADGTPAGAAGDAERHGGGGLGARGHEDDALREHLRRLGREPAVRRGRRVDDRARIEVAQFRRAHAADRDHELAQVVHLVVGIVEDEEAVAAGMADASGDRPEVHQGHRAGGPDRRSDHALSGRQAAGVTRRQAQEESGDQQDDGDDQQELDQREAPADRPRNAAHWIAMTWAKSSLPRLPSALAWSPPRSVV